VHFWYLIKEIKHRAPRKISLSCKAGILLEKLGDSAVCHENTERNKSINEDECGRKNVGEEYVCLG
jgi:hypothetical protein